MKPGAGNQLGRWSTAPRALAKSAWWRGSGALALIGPTDALGRQRPEVDPDDVGAVDPAPPLPPGAQPAADEEPERQGLDPQAGSAAGRSPGWSGPGRPAGRARWLSTLRPPRPGRAGSGRCPRARSSRLPARRRVPRTGRSLMRSGRSSGARRGAGRGSRRPGPGSPSRDCRSARPCGPSSRASGRCWRPARLITAPAPDSSRVQSPAAAAGSQATCRITGESVFGGADPAGCARATGSPARGRPR